MPDQPILAIDYIAFPRFVGTLVRDHPDFKDVKYTQSFPKVESELPCVTYRLISRTPGMDGVETRRSRHKFFIPEDDGSVTQVFTQWMSCIYQFDCICYTNEEADQLVWNFDSLMRNSRNLFLDLGASEVVFDEQIEDQLLRGTTDFCVRSLRWLVRLDQVEMRNTQEIKRIRLNTLFPQEEAVETVVRANGVYDPDPLTQTRISRILYVSDPSPSGIARTRDYIPLIDFDTWYEPKTGKTFIQWFEPGKRPEPGATYYVRYLFWTPVNTLYLPVDRYQV